MFPSYPTSRPTLPHIFCLYPLFRPTLVLCWAGARLSGVSLEKVKINKKKHLYIFLYMCHGPWEERHVPASVILVYEVAVGKQQVA